MVAPVIVLLAFAVPWIHAAIIDQYDCTKWSFDSQGFVYTPQAFVCHNVEPDQVCEALYPSADSAGIYPKAGGNAARPFNCYNSIGRAGLQEQPMVKAAIRLCPKTCGLCCQTSDWTCMNADYPRINCWEITEAQCRDPNWRPLIIEDCPATCGLCNVDPSCVDVIAGCAEDKSICYHIGLQDFVNGNCRRTCNRCKAPTTDAPGTGSKTCTSYIPDTSNACREWDTKYKFCTQTTSTAAEKKKYCATTCKIC